MTQEQFGNWQTFTALRWHGIARGAGGRSLCLLLCLPMFIYRPARAETATWYQQSPGSLTSRGGHYRRYALACAMHSRAAYGRRYRVTDTRTGRSVVVTCNDYCPRRETVDMTPAAARRLMGKKWRKVGRVSIRIRRAGHDPR